MRQSMDQSAGGLWRQPLSTGQWIFAGLLALYYCTVVLAGIHFAVLQVLVLWGLVLVFIPRYRNPPLSRQEIGLLLAVPALFVVALLSYWVNDLADHPDGNLSRYARFLFFVPLYICVRRFATAAGFWCAVLLGALVTGLWGIAEYLGLVRHPEDDWHTVSGAVNPIQFGDLSLLLAMMVGAGLPVYRQYGRWWVKAALLAAALAFSSCLESGTRGAWIAIPAMVLLLVWAFLKFGYVTPRKMLVATIVAATLLGIVIPQTSFISRVQDQIQDIRDYTQGKIGPSAGLRAEMWRASWAVFMQKPILGVGPGLYRHSVQAMNSERGGFNATAMEFSEPHSEYFFVLATLGAMGIAALGFLFFVPLLYFGRAIFSGDDHRRCLGLAGTIMATGYLHFGLSAGLFFQHATFLGFYLLSVAVLVTLIGRHQGERQAGELQ